MNLKDVLAKPKEAPTQKAEAKEAEKEEDEAADTEAPVPKKKPA